MLILSKQRDVKSLNLSIFLCFLLLLAVWAKQLQAKILSNDIRLVDKQLIIKTESGQLIYQSLAGNAIEVRYQAEGIKEFPSFAKKNKLLIKIPLVTETNEHIVFVNGRVKAVINKKDFSAEFYQNEKLLTKQKAFWFKKRNLGFTFTLDQTEIILGAGERVLGMNRRGYRLPLYNRAHYGYTDHSEQMYYSLPYVVSSKGYSVLFDNTAKGWVDIGKKSANELSFEAVGGRAAYIIFAGSSFPNLIQKYVAVTGKQPLPPLWSLGSFASRFGYRDQQEVLQTVALFEQKDIPLDAVVLDLYWFGSEIKGLMGKLDWDRSTFPHAEKMIEQLKKKNINSILVTEPFILSSSEGWKDAVKNSVLAKDLDRKLVKRFDFYFGNTGLVDIFDQSARDWFADVYDRLDKQGVSAVWGDLGEPEVHPDELQHYLSQSQEYVSADILHNAYGHEWAKMVFLNQLKNHPTKRPFVMMRSGFAGSQRYGIIPWTGDVSRTWQGLKSQVELSLTMGLSGLAYTHSDLGGFAGGESFDKELYIRWLQYGVFQPIFRPHGQDHIAPEPVFQDAETISIVRRYIKLRYQLLPYLYNMAYENTTTGMPLMRPLFFDDESDLSLYERTDSYYWGDSLFVSPITEANKNIQKIDLPKGIWFDFWNSQRYVGDQTIEITTPLEKLPLLVKAGAFIPMIDPINNTNDYQTNKLILHYYADQSVNTSRYQLFVDDGSFNSIKNNQYELLNFVAQRNDKALTIDFSRDARQFKSALKTRKIIVQIHQWLQQPNEIFFAQRALAKRAIIYDQNEKLLTIQLVWDHENKQLVIGSTEK
ncbi:MAG: glycoside hydrolase family 31 protein [Enterobacterales bacterium]|nr:glycoside hydrolase family 31 protein [Enterobacterales bacterium]